MILLDGWSKTYAMTGWRLGYGVWPKDLIERRHAAWRSTLHSCVNAASRNTPASPRSTGPQEPVRDMVAAFEERGAVVTVEALNALPGVSCLHARRRLLRLSQRDRHRLVRQGPAGGPAGGGRRGH